jgi:hypothetical protein
LLIIHVMVRPRSGDGRWPRPAPRPRASYAHRLAEADPGAPKDLIPLAARLTSGHTTSADEVGHPMALSAVCLVRDAATGRQYGQAIAHAAKDVDMTASGAVPSNPVGRRGPRADLEGQTDAQVRVGRLSSHRGSRRRHQDLRSV